MNCPICNHALGHAMTCPLVLRGVVILGLGHRAGVGKDTIASHLCAKYGFRQLAFADPLRAAASEVFGINVGMMLDPLTKNKVDEFWGLSPRQVLQKMGTDAMRGTFGEDVWLKALAARLLRYLTVPGTPNRYVITDVRFPNEAAMVKRMNGAVWRIDRPGISDQPTEGLHASETAMLDYKDWDLVIKNDSTEAALFNGVDSMARLLK